MASTETSKTAYSAKITLVDGEDNDVIFTFPGVKEGVDLDVVKTLAGKIAELGVVFESYPVEAKEVALIVVETTTTTEPIEEA